MDNKYGSEGFWKHNFPEYLEKNKEDIPDNVNMQALLACLNYSIGRLEGIVNKLIEKVEKIDIKQSEK